MGNTLNILTGAKARMIEHPGFGGRWNDSNVHIVTTPKRLRAEAPRLAALSVGSMSTPDSTYRRGTLRVTVWVRAHVDQRSDETAVTTGASGLLAEMRDIVNVFSQSFLGGSIEEALRMSTVSAPSRDETDLDQGLVTGFVEFTFGFIDGTPNGATGPDGTGIDRGQP